MGNREKGEKNKVPPPVARWLSLREMEHQQQQQRKQRGGGGAAGTSQSVEAPSRRAPGPTTLHFVLRTEHEAQLYALQAPLSSAGSTAPSAPEITKDDRLRLYARTALALSLSRVCAF